MHYYQKGLKKYQDRKYQSSIQFFMKSLTLKKRFLEAEDINMTGELTYLGSAYIKLGKYPLAKPYCLKALKIRKKILGEDHLETAESYDILGKFYKKTGEYDNSIINYQKALNIKMKILKNEDAQIAESYENIGDIQHKRGKYKKALKYHLKALTIRKSILGEKSLETAESYDDAGRAYKRLGKYKKSLQYYEKALEIRKMIFSSENADIAESFNSLSLIYKKMGKYKKALDYARKTMLLDEKILGSEHPYTTESYANLADIYKIMGDYPSALKYYNKALLIQKKVLGEENAVTAESYSDLGGLYMKMGQYTKSLSYHKKALAIRKKVLGIEHADTTESFHNLSITYKKMSEYPKALEFAIQTMLIDEKILGKKHPYTATSYSDLGDIYKNLGNYPKSLKYYKKALMIQKNILGKNHPYIAESYDDLGVLYQKMGDYLKAQKYYKKALSIREKVLGEAHADTAESYYRISVLYIKAEEYTKALKYAQKTMNIDEKILGKEHPYTATSYENIGIIYRNTGKYDKAMKYHQKALAIRKKVFKEEHIDTAESYSNMGKLYQKTGELKKALKYYKKALYIREKILGKQHPDTGACYYSLGSVFHKTGDRTKAQQYAKQSFEVFLKNRDKTFPILTSKEKERYLKVNQSKTDLLLNTAYSYFLQLKQRDQSNKTKEFLYTSVNAWLNYQGSIFDSENTIAVLYANTKDSELKEKIHTLIFAKRYLAKLYQTLPKAKEKLAWQAKIHTFETKIDTLNNEIAAKASRFKEQQGLKSITYKDITSHLKEDELYIDFARTKHYYYFFTLNQNEEINFIQISKEHTQEIDNYINIFREEISSIASNEHLTDQEHIFFIQKSKETLSKLYTLIIDKHLQNSFQNKVSLIFSLDGALRLLPFETLFNQPKKKYLIEEKKIRYIPSGKEIVRLYKYSKNRNTLNTLVVFADPDFNNKLPSVKKVQENTSSNRSGIIKSLFRMRFAPLPGTKEEAEAIESILKENSLTNYQEENASEMNLMDIKEPHILHIATHGFFINEKNIPNPMLRSGIALSGANVSAIRGKNNGIVTALKLSGLDLKGTDLVVLSACQTGVMDINSTDSLSGLSKAFIQAGAKDIVISLWSVNDHATKELMSSFYLEIQKNKDYAEALKKAKLKMIVKGKHPFYWAAFIVSGL
jgi:CHAT domain-containing protein/Tfp pilus assembly protein PilF